MRKITTITGRSCSGKSTLEKRMVEQGCARVISTTTRPMRAGEVNGVDYYFVTNEEFLRLNKASKFVEKVSFGANLYGVTVHEVERVFALSNHIVIVCEPYGSSQISNWCFLHSVSIKKIFIDTAESVIIDRFLKRFAHEVVSIVGSVTSEKEFESKVITYRNRLLTMDNTESRWRISRFAEYDYVVEGWGITSSEVDRIILDRSLNLHIQKAA